MYLLELYPKKQIGSGKLTKGHVSRNWAGLYPNGEESMIFFKVIFANTLDGSKVEQVF